MGAFGYAVLSADAAADVDVRLRSRDTALRPFDLIINTQPLSSVIHMGRGAVEVAVLGFMSQLTVDDRAATGELLDRLVAIVAGESR